MSLVNEFDGGENKIMSDDVIIRVTVHNCEKLNSEIILKQPVVCMHIVNAENGSYLKKSNSERAVISFYENQRSDIDYIMPVMTKPCSIQGGRFHILTWEESFILNEKFDHVLKQDLNTILFFEVIDLMQPCRKNYSIKSNSNGMQKIAWAFLKVFGSNGIINVGSKLQLQLYKAHPPHKNFKTSKIEVYKWWSDVPRVPLQASLFITIEPFNSFVANPSLRSMGPLQQETGAPNSEQMMNSNENSTSILQDELKRKTSMNSEKRDILWSRKLGEPCKIPTQFSCSLETTGSCHVLKFSPSGRLLLAASGSQENYFLLLYEIPSGKLLQKELAHCEVIHDLDWSHDDSYALSASSDYNVKLWKTKVWMLSASFVHPSFVYSVKFKPTTANIFATACHDHIIRIWASEKAVEIIQELEGHTNSVCAIGWHKHGTKLYSADSDGQLKVWKASRICKEGSCENFFLEKEMPLKFKEISVNKIVPESDDVLCLFFSDSVKLLDLSSKRLLVNCQLSVSSQNWRRGCSSPCGNLLFICHQNGQVSVWNKNTGEQIVILSNTMNMGRLSCVEYHPYDHMLAVSSWEENMPIHIYTINHSNNLNEDDIEIMQRAEANVKQAKLEASNDSVESRKIENIEKHLEIQSTNNILPWHKKSEKYMYDTEHGTDKNSESLSSFSKHKNFTVAGLSLYEKSHGSKKKLQTESHTTAVSKSDEFSAVAGSDNSSLDNLNVDSAALLKSSKRSLRRKRLKDMNKG